MIQCSREAGSQPAQLTLLRNPDAVRYVDEVLAR